MGTGLVGAGQVRRPVRLNPRQFGTYLLTRQSGRRHPLRQEDYPSNALGDTPFAVWLLAELALRGKNERADKFVGDAEERLYARGGLA